MENGGFWFKSSLFEIEPGEDEAINPGVYGMQLAEWLAGKFGGFGYNAEVIEEQTKIILHFCSPPPMKKPGAPSTSATAASSTNSTPKN